MLFPINWLHGNISDNHVGFDRDSVEVDDDMVVANYDGGAMKAKAGPQHGTTKSLDNKVLFS